MVFYKLGYKKELCVELGLGNDWEGILCPKDEGHRRAGRRITELKLKLLSPCIVDFSWTFLADIVVTDRVIQVLRKEGLTGFETKPTTIVSTLKAVDVQKLPKFWEFIVTGTGGHAHPDSGIRLKWECKACATERYSAYEHGIIVDETKWDGTDFFSVVEYPKYILITERAKKVIEDHNLTNVKFTPSHELIWPELVIKP